MYLIDTFYLTNPKEPKFFLLMTIAEILYADTEPETLDSLEVKDSRTSESRSRNFFIWSKYLRHFEDIMKIKKYTLAATLGTSVMLGFMAPAQAGLLGKQLNAAYYVPDTSTIYNQASFSPENFTIAAGQETVGNVENVTDLLVDFTDNTLTITLNTVLSNPTWTNTSFNGIIFTSLAGSLDLASAVVANDTTLAGFDNPRVSFDNDQIFINWNGLSYTNGNVVKINFTSVPEPMSSLGLLAAVGLGFLAKKKYSRY
jgi:hypothetical protein